MRGVSRASLAAVRERVDTLTSGMDEAGARALGDELLAVAHLLDRNVRLRRVLSDAAVGGDQRAALATEVLSGRVSDATSTVVEEVVRAPWSRPVDVVDAADELAAEALFAAEEHADALDDVEDELFRFGRILAREPQLRYALTDPSLPADRKTSVLQDLLGDRVRPATLSLVRDVVLHPRGRTIDRGIDDYGRLAAARRERLVAWVRSVVALSEEQLGRLADGLAAHVGHRVHLNVEIDPGLVGGLTVRVGDELYDGSIAHRIGLARRQMAG